MVKIWKMRDEDYDAGFAGASSSAFRGEIARATIIIDDDSIEIYYSNETLVLVNSNFSQNKLIAKGMKKNISKKEVFDLGFKKITYG